MTSLAQALKSAGALKIAKKAAKSLPGTGEPPVLFGIAVLTAGGTVVGADILVFKTDKDITGGSKSAPLRYLKSQKHWRNLKSDAEKDVGRRQGRGEKADLLTATGVIVNANGRHICVLAGSGMGPGDFKKAAKNLEGPAKSKFGGMPVVKWNKLSSLLASSAPRKTDEETTDDGEETTTETTTTTDGLDPTLFEGMDEEEAAEAREALRALRGAPDQLGMLQQAAREATVEMSPDEEINSMLPEELVGPLGDLFPQVEDEDPEVTQRHMEAAEQARRSVARLTSEFDDLASKIISAALGEVGEDPDLAESMMNIASEVLPGLMASVVYQPTGVLLSLIRAGKLREARGQLDTIRAGLGSGGKLGQLEQLAGDFGAAFSASELLEDLSSLIQD